MAFELSPGEDAANGLRRIVRERVEEALRCLASSRRGAEARRIHTARKRFKEVRAALRLARGAIDERLFRKENLEYRDAARPLSIVRDASALIDALDTLVAHFRDELRPKAFDPVRKLLRARARLQRRRIVVEEHALKHVHDRLRRSGRRIDRWRLDGIDHDAFAAGLERTYRAGRRARAACAARGSDENLHEWRKQGKYLRHEVEILRPIWPKMMKALAGQAKDLADLLGDDHDLGVMKQLLAGELAADVDRREREALSGLIDERRTRLQKRALRVGRKLYAEKPKAFVRRVKEYLNAWA